MGTGGGDGRIWNCNFIPFSSNSERKYSTILFLCTWDGKYSKGWGPHIYPWRSEIELLMQFYSLMVVVDKMYYNLMVVVNEMWSSMVEPPLWKAKPPLWKSDAASKKGLFLGVKTKKLPKIFLWLRDTYKKHILPKNWVKTAIAALSSGHSNLHRSIWGCHRQLDDQYRNPNIE